jgi:hypothetical protein
MARASAFVLGLVCGIALGTAIVVSHAQDPDDSAEVAHAAEVAGVDPVDLKGAMLTTGIADPFVYLRRAGELENPPPAAPTPYNARVACIEARESGGANVPNARGSGAVGVMQYMPSTFFAHAAEMGHFDWSPWNPEQARAVAAHDLALGRRAQWTVGGC